MFGIVYTRKRRRVDGGQNDKMFGIRFSRRQLRKKVEDSEKAYGLVGSVGGSCCHCVFEGLVMCDPSHLLFISSLHLYNIIS